MSYDINHKQATNLIRSIDTAIKDAEPKELKAALELIRSSSPQTDSETLSSRSISPTSLKSDSTSTEEVDIGEIALDLTDGSDTARKTESLAQICLGAIRLEPTADLTKIEEEGFSTPADYIKHKLIQEINTRVEQKALLRPSLEKLREVTAKPSAAPISRTGDSIGNETKRGSVIFYLSERKKLLNERKEALESQRTQQEDTSSQAAITSQEIKSTQSQIEAIETLIQNFESREKLMLFPKGEEKRNEAYQNFATRIALLFEKLTPEDLDAAFAIGEGSLCDLPEVCFTGWHERIEAKIPAHLSEKQDLLGFSLAAAKNKRRSIAETDLKRQLCIDVNLNDQQANDAHTIAVAKILLNERFALGYSENELSQNESRSYLSLYKNNLQLPKLEKIFNAKYTPQSLAQAAKDAFQNLSPEDKDHLLEEARSIYFNAAQKDRSLYFDNYEALRSLYNSVAVCNMLKIPKSRETELSNLINQCLAHGIQAFSLLPKDVTRIDSNLRREAPRQMLNIAKPQASAQGIRTFVESCKKAGVFKTLSSEDQEKLTQLSVDQNYLIQHRKDVKASLSQLETEILKMNCMAFERALVDLDPHNRARKQLSDFGASVLLNAAGVTTPIQEDEESIEASATCHFLESMKESLARKEASKGITSDQDFLLSKLSDENVLYLADESLLSDPNFMQKAAQKNIKSLRFADPKLFDNHTFREEFLFTPEARIVYPELVANLPKDLKNNSTFVQPLLDQCPDDKIPELVAALGKDLKNNAPFIQDILDSYPLDDIHKLVAVLGKELKNDPSFISPLLDQVSDENLPDLIKVLGTTLRNSSQFIEQRLNSYPRRSIPEFVAALGEELRNDRGFMTQALARCKKSQLSNLVKALGSELKDSKSFMQIVIDQYAPKDLGSLLDLLNNTLKADVELVSDLISRAKTLNPVLTLQDIRRANSSANDDAVIMGHLLKHCNHTNIVGFSRHLGPTLKNDPEFATQLLEKTSMHDISNVVPLLGSELKNNADFMRSALAIYSDYNVHSFIEVLGDNLKSNKAFIREALAKCKRSELDNFQEAMGDAGYEGLESDLRARRGGRSFFSAYRFFT